MASTVSRWLSQVAASTSPQWPEAGRFGILFCSGIKRTDFTVFPL
jgi:hypothetical protein